MINTKENIYYCWLDPEREMYREFYQVDSNLSTEKVTILTNLDSRSTDLLAYRVNEEIRLDYLKPIKDIVVIRKELKGISIVEILNTGEITLYLNNKSSDKVKEELLDIISDNLTKRWNLQRAEENQQLYSFRWKKNKYEINMVFENLEKHGISNLE